MKKILSTLVIIFICIAVQAQKLEQMIARDTTTTIFRLNKSMLHHIIITNKILDTNWYYQALHSKVSANNFSENQLPFGNYLITNFINHQVHYKVVQKPSFDIISTNIRKDVVFYITDKTTKQICKDAVVAIYTIPIPYDSGYGGYAITKEKLMALYKKNKGHLIDVQHKQIDYVQQVSVVKQPKPAKNYPYSYPISAGYMILNKPVYKPLDTLQLKAYLVNNKNGEPISKNITLKITEPSTDYLYETTLKSTTAGAYLHKWVLPDSLEIDNTYTATISYMQKGKMISKSETFYLEDYELAKNNFDIQIVKPTFYNGEDICFTVSATDANRFPLNGVQLSYTLRLASINNILKDSLHITDAYSSAIYHKDTIVPYDRINTFSISSALLPMADAQYTLDVEVIDPVTFEKKEQTLSATKVRKAVNTLLYQSADSACIRVLYNNKDTTIPYTLLAVNGIDTLLKKNITTPYYHKLAPNTTAIFTIDAQNNVQQLPIRFNALQIGRTAWKRKIDSVHFSFQYPFATPFYYKIFKEDVLVQSGETKNLEYNGFDNSQSKYTLLFTQQLNSTIVDHFYSITIEPPLHQLNISNDMPTTAFPGQKLIVSLQINDANGKPASNVNLASFAQNAQFGDRLKAPTILVPSQYYHLADVQNILPKTDLQFFQLNISNNYPIKPKHIIPFDLHKNEWYQLHHNTLQLHTISIPTINDQSEYCVVIEKNKQLYTPKYLMANDEYVYINDINGAQKYSVFTNANQAQKIIVRFANYKIQLASMQFAPHTKTIIVLHADSLDRLNPLTSKIISIDTMPAFTPTLAEKEAMLNSVILVNNIPSYDTICLQTNSNESRFDSTRISIMGTINIGEDAFAVLGPVPQKAMPSITINRVKHNMAKGLKVNYYNVINGDFTTRNYQKSITEQLFSFVETGTSVQNLLYKIIADTISSKPIITNADYIQTSINTKKYTDNNYIQNFDNSINDEHINIILQNNNDSIYVKAVWVVDKNNYKQSVFKSNIARTNFVSIPASALAQSADVYLLLNGDKYIKYNDMHLPKNMTLYIQPMLCNIQFLELQTLDSALLIYNKITAIPMQPFYHQPRQIKSTAIELKNKLRKNIYLYGAVRDEQLMPIPNAIVILEINGTFQYGAITNSKGAYEFLDIPSATYQVKVFATNYGMLHILPQSYVTNRDYLLNIGLQNTNEQAPVWQSINNDFRMMAFIKDEMENKIKIQVYDADTREPIDNVLVKLEQYSKQTIQKILHIDQEIPFLKTNEHAELLIEKPGYQTLELYHLRCEDGYYYTLDVFLKKLNSGDTKSIQTFALTMNNFVKLTTQSIIENRNIKLSYSKKASTQITSWIDGVILQKGEPIKGVKIDIWEAGIKKYETITNAFGRFFVEVKADATYNIIITNAGMQLINIENILIVGDNVANLQITLSENNKRIDGIKVSATRTRKPLTFNTNNTVSIIDAKKIEKLATTNAIDGASLSAGSYQAKKGEGFRIGGGRAENTMVVVDGIMATSGSNNISYESMGATTMVIAGMQASFGDESGGVEQGNIPTAEDEKLDELLLDPSYNALRKNFTDVGYWQPNFYSNKAGKAVFTITLPDNITTWRAHTMAMGSGFRHAVLSQNIAVYKPLQTMSVVPTYLYKGDALNAKANFINLTSATKKVQTYISINNNNVMSDTLNLEKQYASKYTIRAKNLDTIQWQAGLLYDTNYKDAEQFMIPVFSSALATYQNQSINMDEDSLYQLLIEPNTKGIITFNNNMYEKIMLYIDELGKYEYGCVEQTTSKLKAVLYKQQILTMMGKKVDVEFEVKMLMNKLKDLQNKQNTWGWWRNQYADWNITLYVCDVLQQANSAGFSNSLYLSALNTVSKNLATMPINDAMYALYILQKTNTVGKQWTNVYNSVNTNSLNTTAKMYYYKLRLNNADKVSDADLYSIILEMKNNRAMNYERHFFYEPKADWFRAFLLFKNTKWENEMMARFKNEMLSGAEKNLNTFTKVMLVEALVQKSKSTKANDINAKIIVNDTTIITTFPYSMPILHTKYNMQHSGADVYVNTAEAITIDAPIITDTLFAVKTYFSTNTILAGKPVDFILNIQALRTASYVMVEIPIPSGMHIDEAQKKELLDSDLHIEFYKHKINMYYTSMPKGTYQTIFKMLPNFTGTFTLPATKASLMYYPYVYGCNENRMVVVE